MPENQEPERITPEQYTTILKVGLLDEDGNVVLSQALTQPLYFNNVFWEIADFKADVKIDLRPKDRERSYNRSTHSPEGDDA